VLMNDFADVQAPWIDCCDCNSCRRRGGEGFHQGDERMGLDRLRH
jgi:hypothetical protein